MNPPYLVSWKRLGLFSLRTPFKKDGHPHRSEVAVFSFRGSSDRRGSRAAAVRVGTEHATVDRLTRVDCGQQRPLCSDDKKGASMWVGRLVNLIEDHADELTGRLVRSVREDPRTIGYRQFGDEELGKRAREVYSHLGQWLGATSEGAVESEYFRLGKIRRAEGIPLSEVIMALLLVRRNLWQFVESQGADTSLELRQQLDLELLVVRFFDRAIFHTVRGYESGGRSANSEG